MADKKIDLIKGALTNFIDGIKDLNIEAKDWALNVGGTSEGTTVDISIKLLIPKKK